MQVDSSLVKRFLSSPCPVCKGKSTKFQAIVTTCTTCCGRKQISGRSCQSCGGTGKGIKTLPREVRCKVCNGEGTVRV